MYDAVAKIGFTLNGRAVETGAAPYRRLSEVLREDLETKGVKVGCDAGDCGACSVLVDGELVCACLTAVGQVDGCTVETVEGLGTDGIVGRLKRAFLHHGAAQCGICTPGMLTAATALLRANPTPDERQAADALGGVLCRCTGYRKILTAVTEAHRFEAKAPVAAAGQAVGARLERLDGLRKLDGSEIFGADEWPADALVLKVIRAPHHHATFKFGDIAGWVAANPGIERVFTAADVPGKNCFGVIPPFADQPVFAVSVTRFRGEAVAAVAGTAEAMAEIDLGGFPVAWEKLEALIDIDSAQGAGAAFLHEKRAGNILTNGRVAKGDVERGLSEADAVVEGSFETGFVEHAYIEPEAGFARRVGDRIEIQACTQAPFMDRDDMAIVLGLAPERVRILPSAVGGGFGSKLDLSLQPFIGIAAWLMDRPVRMVYSRAESIMSTTKRHPSRISMRIGAKRDGKLTGIDFFGAFNTGAYASFGPTVANRVPVHASGPYFVPHYLARARAVHTHLVPAGAFRGFGVPQAAVAQEQLYDVLADKLGIDRLEFRIRNALGNGQPTVTGQVFANGVGFKSCLEALRPAWVATRVAATAFNAATRNARWQDARRRGVGVAGMWYGCGNTSLANPSTIRVGLKADGRIALFQGAVDIGQGSNTVVTQICADALGAPIDRFDLLSADTDRTPDAGKTSASRQTFVSGKAAYLAGKKLRQTILRLANAGDDATIEFAEGRLTVSDGGRAQVLELARLPRDAGGYVALEEGYFDPPTTTLDADGQGEPYAVFGFGAHLAEIEVDLDLGTIKVLKLICAHDVGRAINPTLVEGQIEGGAAQGLGLALMEEFIPGKGENLHDYLIPTIGDMPPVESILIEEAAEIGPFGAKGIGEQALIPTAPAILNALYDAAGIRVHKLPATPDRVRAAILERDRSRR